MSVESIITENLDIWTSAIKTKSAPGRGSSNKLELYGIKKLRELILDLAVRGKLVHQDPSDEPATLLLERIKAQKAGLIADKLIKKPKALPKLSDSDVPFELPESWSWTYLQDVTSYIQRGKGPKYAEEGNVKVISQKCIQNSGFSDTQARYVADESLGSYGEERYLKESDLLWNSTGTGTVGRINVLPNIRNQILVADSHVTVIRPLCIQSWYMWCFISSPTIQMRIAPDHENSLVSGSTKQVELNTSAVQSLLVPVAPLQEQARIVKRVNDLMTLCDQLESQTEASIEAHKILVKSLLETLTNAKDTDELNDSWQRISAHFDVLFTTEDSIDQLQQTILQLAVMGKLVKQDPNDEPASKLLERIAAEKEQLIKDKKIKKQKPLPEISEQEKPFDIPDGWCFCRLDDICFGITSGSTPPKSEFRTDDGVPYLKVYNIRNQKVDFDYQRQFVSNEFHKSKLTRSILKPNDVIMNIVGPPLGKVAVVPEQYPEWNCNQAIVFFRPIQKYLSPYIYQYLIAGKFLNSIELIGTAGQDNISVTKSRSIVLPLPPLEEQKRIIGRANEILTICVELLQAINKLSGKKITLTDCLVNVQ